MENLSIEQTKYTPTVQMTTAGLIRLVGKSYPENSFEFYRPLMLWLRDYLKSPLLAAQLRVDFEIDYFNSSTSSLFYDFFELLNQHQSLSNIVVNWYYKNGDESILEAGEDFRDDFPDMQINLCVK
jgi:hypothetical protein